jgi:S-adenosylmethionine:tRNA ribosyltransferase-isomerase
MNAPAPASIDFELPAELAAHEPPEARGLPRDAVRLMVSRRSDDTITHTQFRHLDEFLAAGDVLVVNASATINASFPGMLGAENIRLHLSTRLAARRWVVELRRIDGERSSPLLDGEAGDRVQLPGGESATLIAPFSPDGNRLWIAQLSMFDVLSYAANYGAPIRYGYVQRRWPLRYYQTIFSREPGSVEMPSAARPFTRELVGRLEAKGIEIAPLILHTGVASLESHEAPYSEWYRVPGSTADTINRARAAGKRVVAVGTTSVRALETVATEDGAVTARQGWTDLVIMPQRGLFAIDALLTGFHAPHASHLWLLETLAGHAHLAIAYEAAVQERYLWHEFGDVHLILP